MVYLQRNVPPPSKILSFTIKDFSGGLNNNSNQINLNEASDLLNMSFNDEVTMRKRFGVDNYNAWSHGADVTFMMEFVPYTGVSQIISASNTQVFADGTAISTVTGKINGVNYMGRFIFVDGAKIRIYGKFPQATAGNDKVVGTPVATNIVMEVTNPPSGFTPAASPATRGFWNYDYTNHKVWYEPCAAEVADTYKGSNVLPDSPKYVDVHGGRLFLAGSTNDDDNVFISDISNGFYFPVFLPIQLPPTGDQIMGLKVYQDSVVVGRKTDVHVVYGNTNRTDLNNSLFRLKRINTHTGFASQDAVTLVNNYLFYLGNDGNFYAMNSTKTDVEQLSTSILNRQLNLFKTPISITSVDLATARAIYFKDEWYIAIKDVVIVYSYRHRAFTLYRYTNCNITSFLIKNYQLLMGSNRQTIITSTLQYLDFGIPYRGFWKSKNFDMDDPSSYKQFREFYIVANTFDNFKSNIDLRFEIDYIDVNEGYSISNQMAIWGKSKWGDRFINRNVIASLPIIIGRRGRIIRITYSCGRVPSAPVATYQDLIGYLDLKDGTLVFVQDEGKYYLYNNFSWTIQGDDDLNQPMLVYEINGSFEIRGKR